MTMLIAILGALLSVQGSGPEKPPQEPPESQDPLRPPAPGKLASPKDAAPALRVRARLEIEYTSNVLRLSEEEIDQVEDGTNPAKFRIHDVDDFIYRPEIEAALPFRLLDAEGLAGLRAIAHLYQNNSILNHPELGAFLERGGFSLEYAFQPDVYRREYRALDSGLFESAFYDQHDVEASQSLRVHEGVKLRPQAGLRFRDYDSPFNHRDAIRYQLALRGRVRVMKDLEAVAEYEVLLNDAFASSGQPDTSYLEHGPELGLAYGPAAWEIGVFYRFAVRDYTTGNAAAVDPGHRDREENRTRLVLKAGWKITKALAVDAELTDTRVDSDRPSDAGATDEETDWERQEFVVGLRYAF